VNPPDLTGASRTVTSTSPVIKRRSGYCSLVIGALSPSSVCPFRTPTQQFLSHQARHISRRSWSLPVSGSSQLPARQLVFSSLLLLSNGKVVSRGLTARSTAKPSCVSVSSSERIQRHKQSLKIPASDSLAQSRNDHREILRRECSPVNVDVVAGCDGGLRRPGDSYRVSPTGRHLRDGFSAANAKHSWSARRWLALESSSIKSGHDVVTSALVRASSVGIRQRGHVRQLRETSRRLRLCCTSQQENQSDYDKRAFHWIVGAVAVSTTTPVFPFTEVTALG